MVMELITMAKKAKAEKKPVSEEVQKKMEKYYKAKESEKRGKELAGSVIGFSLLCFIILLVVLLKMSGVGKTIKFTTDENGNPQTEAVDTADVEATNLADIAGEKLMDEVKD